MKFMAKAVSSFELTLHSRSQGQTRATWLYNELRTAILEGRLKYGARLPATRDFARFRGDRLRTVANRRVSFRARRNGHVGESTRANRYCGIGKFREDTGVCC